MFIVFMNKKDVITQILEKLSPYRPSADGILLLIHEQEVDDQLIDGILHLTADALRTTSSLVANSKLQKSQKFLKKIKDQEKQHIDQQEAEFLLADLDNGRS